MTSAAIVVREAGDADLAAAGDISVAAYAAAGQLEPGSPYTATLRDTAARAREAVLLVAERDGAIVGTVTICPPGSPFHEIGGPDELEFRFLAVAPEAQGTGVAQALMSACADRAAHQGLSRFAICVRDNNHSAYAMYEHLGFTRSPDRDWSPRPGVDLLALTRGLGTASSS